MAGEHIGMKFAARTRIDSFQVALHVVKERSIKGIEKVNEIRLLILGRSSAMAGQTCAVGARSWVCSASMKVRHLGFDV